MFENESWAGDVVYLDNPEDIWAYDTTEPGDGAPGKPGEIRWCYAELNSGVKVLQKRRLTRLALLLGASVVKGSYLELGTGSYFVADALAPANMPLTDAAGFVSEEVNREGKGSVAQGVLPTGYWFWAVVEGLRCDHRCRRRGGHPDDPEGRDRRWSSR